MSVHPLSLPEIVAVVSNHLPLWEQNYDPLNNRWNPRFNPTSLRACVMVSTLWRRAFLPVLWTIYDYSVLIDTPSNQLVTQLFSPHFRLARVADSTTCLLEDCTRLLELTIDAFINSNIQPQEYYRSSPLKAIVRANPGLRKLDWHGRSQSVSFDHQDVEGLENLEELRLVNWDFSSGQLPRLLKRHSASLKTLQLSSMQGNTQGELMAPPLSLGLTTDSEEIAAAATITRRGNYLEMGRLETLVVGSHTSGNQYLSDLVRCCPALRELTVQLDGYGDNRLLTDSLRNHCPKLHSLTLDNDALPALHIEGLIKNASTGGFRKLQFGPAGVGDGSLISDVLTIHAATLEDIHVSCVDRVDLQQYARLFTECPNLKEVNLHLQGASGTGVGFLDMLLSEQPLWVCRNLERLELGPFMSPGMEDDLKRMGVLPPITPPPAYVRRPYLPSQRTMDPKEQEEIASKMGKIKMQQLFEKVETLKNFTIDRCVFTCAPL